MLDQKSFVSQLERLSLKKVITNATSIMKAQAMLRNIKIGVGFKCNDLMLDIDNMRTTQILFNLISNAIKFSNDSGRIIVKCEHKMIEQAKFQVELSVIDQGIGISDED